MLLRSALSLGRTKTGLPIVAMLALKALLRAMHFPPSRGALWRDNLAGSLRLR